jgi:hypothetical protein
VRRVVVLIALAACNEPAEQRAQPRSWVYPPALAAWPQGIVSGSIGRSQAPQVALAEGIEGTGAPLRLPTPWAVPGDAPRVLVYGQVAGQHAIEMIDIDKGRELWRDSSACAAPVVGVTAEAIVCADAKGVRGVGLDGKSKWKSDATYIGMTDERVITAGAGESVILDANVGDELARVKLPAGVLSDSIIASCGDAGRELFAYGQEGRLVHVVEAPGGPKVAWSVPLPLITQIDACEDDQIVALAGTSLVSITRATGAITGSVENVRGYWPARDGSARLEVSANGSVRMYARDLVASEPVALPVLGELLAKRDDKRLVRATPATAALLDRKGVRAYLPLAELGAVLGDTAIVAASWTGSPGETVHRIPIPAPYPRRLRVPRIAAPLAVRAELRDLPAVTELDAAGAIAKLDAGKASVGAVALAGTAVFATALEHEPDDTTGAGVARFELTTKSWTWYRGDGCGPGTPVALAVAHEVVVCAARSNKGASIHATTLDGQPRWTWNTETVDGVDAAGDILVVRDADRLVMLDTHDGRELAHFASDDGGAMPAAPIDIDGMTMVVTAERGRVMARLPRARMIPAWTLAVLGSVRSIQPAGDGVLVDLEDGDAYRIDGRTGAATAMPGLGLVWRTTGDLITGEAPGGPIAPAVWGPPPAPKLPARKLTAAQNDFDPMQDPPRLPKPWPMPPNLTAAWQYTLYEATGALRARNDYALDQPITPAHARTVGAPLVVQSGAGLREILVVDPVQGDPVKRIRLPEDAAPGTAFSTIVDGKPVVGSLLANPLRVVLF